MYKTSSKSDNFSLRYGDLTIFFKMAAVRHLEFYTSAFLSRSPCHHAVLLSHTKFRWNRTIGQWFMAKKAIFKMAAVAILNIKNCNFWSRGGNQVQYLMQCTKFHQNGTNFHWDIWQFDDFQNGGRPPCCNLKMCSFCHVALVDLLFCFLIQNFADIGQSVND